jgi:hypothetical protein
MCTLRGFEMNLTTEQVKTYNGFINRIKTTIDSTMFSFMNTPVNKLKEVIVNNGDIWKKIQTDIFATDLPRDIKIKLSLICDDGFREYEKRLNKAMQPEN